MGSMKDSSVEKRYNVGLIVYLSVNIRVKTLGNLQYIMKRCLILGSRTVTTGHSESRMDRFENGEGRRWEKTNKQVYMCYGDVETRTSIERDFTGRMERTTQVEYTVEEVFPKSLYRLVYETYEIVT